MTIKIAHEAPVSIVKEIDKITDYSYFLVHLFEENEEYLNWAKEVVNQGRECILDNSIFELGIAFDTESYVRWIKEIKPTYYIIPDSLENKDKTIELFNTFINNYKDLPGKTIAVAQGKTYEDFCDCYSYLVDKVDKIAIPFDFNFLIELFDTKYPHYKEHDLVNPLIKFSMGRGILIDKMIDEGIINKNKKHHLLGCFLASEFSSYRDNSKYEFIDSLDTSNPVVAGLKLQRYMQLSDKTWGLLHKPKEKLFTLINTDVSDDQKEMILYNVNKFKSNIN